MPLIARQDHHVYITCSTLLLLCGLCLSVLVYYTVHKYNDVRVRTCTPRWGKVGNFGRASGWN